MRQKIEIEVEGDDQLSDSCMQELQAQLLNSADRIIFFYHDEVKASKIKFFAKEDCNWVHTGGDL